MKTKLVYWVMGGVALMGIAACEKQAMIGSPELESLQLEKLYLEIDSLARLYPCEEAGDWHFTAVGEKACGGPAGYIAYSVKLDTAGFLNKVALYTERQKAYNVKWDVISDCMFLLPPSYVACEDGQAKLIWDDQVYVE